MAYFPRRSTAPATKAALRSCTRSIIEQVESRIHFHFTVAAPLPDVNVSPGTATSTVNLAGTIDSDEITGSVVRMETSSGNVDLHLFDAAKPLTVTNFLKYVNQGRYVGTFIHRDADLDDNPSSGVEVIQGGGYVYPGFTHIPTDEPVADELNANGVRSNTRGTISMAKSGPNTATSEFFINTADNTALDSPSLSGGFTVFGEIINNTMSSVDAIDALPKFNFDQPFNTLPLRNYTQAQFEAGTPITDEHLVMVTSASVVPETTYTATSSNPALVTADLSGNTLTLNYAAGQLGTAEVTVTGTGLDGSVLTDSFLVSVGDVAITIGDNAAKAVTFTDTDGTTATIKLKGGTATVSLAGTDLTQTTDRRGITVTGGVGAISSINLDGTNSASNLKVNARGGDGVLEVGNITAPGGLRNLSGKALSVNGDVNLGLANKVDLADITSGSLTIGGASQVTINLPGGVDDSDITSAGPIRNLKTGRFAGADGEPQSIVAPAISKLKVDSDFAGNLTVQGTLNNAKIGGGVSGGTWNVGNLGKAVVGGDLSSDINVTTLNSLRAGSITNADILSSGTLRTVQTGSMTGSRIYASVNGLDLPDDPSDLGTAGLIRSVTVRGDFVDSRIAAETLGNISLGTVNVVNAGSPFGVAGATIARVNGTDSLGSSLTRTRLTEPTQSFEQQDFKIRVF